MRHTKRGRIDRDQQIAMGELHAKRLEIEEKALDAALYAFNDVHSDELYLGVRAALKVAIEAYDKTRQRCQAAS